MSDEPDRRIEEWQTVAVAPLPPGWRNVYRDDDATTHTHACPAVLLQELRAIRHIWDVPEEGRYAIREKTWDMEPPYETRAVFADHDWGHLAPANDTSNYDNTIGPEDT